MTSRLHTDRRAFFLDTPGGRRFAMVSAPSSTVRGAWLYLHPFAEEMNKSRRMASLAAQALAAEGWLVLQVDFGGCGDSDGGFEDARWHEWLDDISASWSWLRDQCRATAGIWSLRAGSLLAANWITRTRVHPPLLFWQPVGDGQRHLTQFLRLKAANEMLSKGTKDVMTRLIRQLDSGQAVEVAGYTLSSDLARGLGEAQLVLPDDFRAPAKIIEIARDAAQGPSPAISKLARQWREASVPITIDTVSGPRFWQTVEIETVPRLVEATVRAAQELIP